MRRDARYGNSPAAWIRNDPGNHKFYSEIGIMELFDTIMLVVHCIHSEYTVNIKNYGGMNDFRKDIDVSNFNVYGIISFLIQKKCKW